MLLKAHTGKHCSLLSVSATCTPSISPELAHDDATGSLFAPNVACRREDPLSNCGLVAWNGHVHAHPLPFFQDAYPFWLRLEQQRSLQIPGALAGLRQRTSAMADRHLIVRRVVNLL